MRSYRFVVAGLVLAAACSDPAAPLTGADVAGTYALATINGQSLPTLYGGGAGITSTIVADTLVLVPAGTWSDQTVFGTTTSAVTQRGSTYSGTWTFDASTSIVRATYPLPHNQTDTLAFRVGTHSDALTFDAGPVTPYNYGTGLWVYARVR